MGGFAFFAGGSVGPGFSEADVNVVVWTTLAEENDGAAREVKDELHLVKNATRSCGSGLSFYPH